MFTTIRRKYQAVIFNESEQMSHMFPTTEFTVLQLVERQEEIRFKSTARGAEVDSSLISDINNCWIFLSVFGHMYSYYFLAFKCLDSTDRFFSVLFLCKYIHYLQIGPWPSMLSCLERQFITWTISTTQRRRDASFCAEYHACGHWWLKIHKM